MTTTTTTQAPSKSNYINLHTVGLGYMSRVRHVKVRGGEFMAASIRAMHGEKGVKDGVQYVPFDVKAATDQAAAVLECAMADANNDNKRVMVRFTISDYFIDSFKYTSGTKAGETGTALKGRLLEISHVWVQEKLNDAEKTGEKAPWVCVFEKSKEAPAEADNGSAEAPMERSGT